MSDPLVIDPTTHIGDIDEFHWRAAFEDEDPRLPVLLNTRRMLRHMRLGLDDLLSSDDPERRELGFYNAVIYGRSVTLAAQNFRTQFGAQFNEWYAPFVYQMREDELMKYFQKLRNTLLKGVPPPILHSPTAEMTEDAFTDLQRFIDETPKPENATGFLINVRGKSGWEVRHPNGTTEVLDTPIPNYLKESYLRRSHLPDAPRTHLGKEIEDRSLEGLCTLYTEYLTLFVAQLGVWARHLEVSSLG